jgi:hypothetical protein
MQGSFDDDGQKVGQWKVFKKFSTESSVGEYK